MLRVAVEGITHNPGCRLAGIEACRDRSLPRTEIEICRKSKLETVWKCWGNGSEVC